MRSRSHEPYDDAPHEFRQANDITDPLRHTQPYYGNLSAYERSGEARFPESFINRDQRGLHSGKGPRSYTRTDERVREIVCDKLCDDPLVDASHMEVTVNNGEVILTGSVEDRKSKRRAEDIVETIPGIRHIENRLRVQHEKF